MAKTKEFMVNFPGEDLSYPVFFGEDFDLTSKLISSDIAEKKKDARIAIITDSNVKPLYQPILTKALEGKGFSPLTLEIPAGEQSKSFIALNEIIETLLKKDFDKKSTLLIALGGGVVGDLTGTIAMLLHRGVDYIQVPTTLLSQVDSSIGFKVAVNTSYGKNLLGGFYPPKAVYSDVSVLSTLKHEQYSSGLGEAIKMAISSDSKLFKEISSKCARGNLSSKSLTDNLELVKRCCQIKKSIVELDPRENNPSGIRSILNLGHTIGHALELESDYTALHGYMVSLGIVGASYLSFKRGILKEKDLSLIESTLSSADLPIRIPKELRTSKNETLLSAMKIDKKSESGKIFFVFPESLGSMYKENSRYKIPVKESEIIEALNYLRS